MKIITPVLFTLFSLGCVTVGGEFVSPKPEIKMYATYNGVCADYSNATLHEIADYNKNKKSLSIKDCNFI